MSFGVKKIKYHFQKIKLIICKIIINNKLILISSNKQVKFMKIFVVFETRLLNFTKITIYPMPNFLRFYYFSMMIDL